MSHGSPDLTISRIELQKVADFLPYPFIIAEVIDGIHMNTYLNENFLQEIGYSLQEIPTLQDWYEKAYPDFDYRNKVITNWNQTESESAKESIISVKHKTQVTCKNGSKRWYEVKASVINLIHVVAFVDLDKEIALQEKLKTINENNDRMLSILGHDLRSPVANLMGISSMAEDSDISNTEFITLIKLIKEQSGQVLELLDNTLNWARMNFNGLKPVYAEINVKILVDGILKTYKSAFEAKHISIEVIFNNTKSIISDSEILTIIIRNLISNAIKFTPQSGSIQIKITDTEISVTDSGIGISPKMINDIFYNNYSSRNGTENEHGIGIGLQMVINLTEKINWKLQIQSIESKGTTMRLLR